MPPYSCTTTALRCIGLHPKAGPDLIRHGHIGFFLAAFGICHPMLLADLTQGGQTLPRLLRLEPMGHGERLSQHVYDVFSSGIVIFWLSHISYHVLIPQHPGSRLEYCIWVLIEMCKEFDSLRVLQPLDPHTCIRPCVLMNTSPGRIAGDCIVNARPLRRNFRVYYGICP